MNPFLSFLIKLVKHSQETSKKTIARQIDEDFIPYVCHYSPNTILTKNGELMQIIRITGFSNSSAISQIVSLRESVREVILKHIKETKFAFWFNTIRRKKNITPKSPEGFENFFTKNLDQAWIEENVWNDQYVNELYITIIVEGFDTSVANFGSFLRSFSYFSTKFTHRRFLEESSAKLNKVVNNIANDLKDYGAKILGITDWEGILYSEPMRFFGKIVNLYEERYPLSSNDISHELSTHKIAFGDRQLEVVGYNNKNFAAMLSLKEYAEVSAGSLDRILQLPLEFIITQSFDFSFNKKELSFFEYQNNLAKTSGDEELRQVTGIANLVKDSSVNTTDYGKLQTTFMFINKTINGLENDVRKALEQITALGLVVVREDIFSEHCFWSQLPGNFFFLRRQKTINSESVAGFSALHNFPSGSMAGNHWGPSVTILKTVLNTPYFFNFHDIDAGHTLVVGPPGSGKTVLINFLLAQAQRFKNKIFYFDFNESAKCFIHALSGKYHTISRDSAQNDSFLKINPFKLSNRTENKLFLTDFINSLVSFAREPIPQEEKELIPQVVDHILASNANNLALAIEAFNHPETQNLHQRLMIWQDQTLAHIFSAEDNSDFSNPINAFDLTEILSQKPILIPVINHLFHSISNSLDGSKTIMVIKNAEELLENPIIAPKFQSFLTLAQKQNCVVILTISNVENMSNSLLFPSIRENFTTEIFMPNPEMSGESAAFYSIVLGLNEEEVQIVKMMEQEEHHIFFKRAMENVIASIDLSKPHLFEFLKILSADQMTVAAMEEVLANSDEDTRKKPEIWLPQLFEVIQAIEKERLEEEKEKFRQQSIARRKRFGAGVTDD